MRIAVNTRFFIPGTLEGVGYFTREICRRLPELLPEAEFLYCFDRSFDPSLVAHPRITGRALFPPARDPLLWRAWFDYALPRALRQWGADVLLSPDGYCSLRTAVPQVLVTHDLAYLHYPGQVPRRVQRYYEKNVPRFLARAERIVTVSEFVRQDIHQNYGTDLDKISVAANGVQADFRPLSPAEVEVTRREYAEGRPYFFYLGSVHPRKNIARLIRAYGQFRKRGPALPLLLGGRLAWQSGEIMAAYRDSAYHEDIHFLGYLPQEQVVRILGGARALVYPSLSEGFGVPLLEAMHAEVPIIASHASSLPEVGGKAVLYVDPEREESLAEGMLRLIHEPGLAENLVREGRRQRKRFSWDGAAQVVAAALREAVPA